MILFVHPADELYGADRVALAVIAALREHDDVLVWLPTDVAYPKAALSRQLAASGIPVEFVPLPVLRRAHLTPRGLATLGRRAAALRPRLRDAAPDAVYVNTSALAPVVPLARSLGIPSDVHVHEALAGGEAHVIGQLLRPARRVIVVSESVRRGLPRHLRIRAEVVRHRIADPVRPEDRIGAEALRSTVGLGPSDTAVLLASRWSPAKGVPVIVDALGQAGRSDVHLVIAGGIPPSGASVDVAAHARRSPAARRIHILGELEDMRPWFAAADAVAVPSVFPDPYPTIALEAVAAGLPVLASDVGGLPEIVTPEVGMLVPPGDTTAWADALAALPHRGRDS